MYKGPVIDVDIHHQPRSPADLLPHVPARSRDLLERTIAAKQPVERGRWILVAPGGAMRLDATAPDGSPPGSSHEMMCEQHLDPCGVRRALLTHNVGEYGSHPNPYLSADLCTAVNHWNAETWLSHDDRLYSGVVVSPQLPDVAQAEIRRWADHPRMSAVIMGGLPLHRPYGDPLYHPVYEAAAEADLAIAVHLGFGVQPGAQSVAGAAASVSELNLHLGNPGSHIVTSLIVHGVFEKYPNLRFVLNEYSLAWLPPLLWSLDAAYPTLKRESPWVRRPPSEYVREFIRFSTQPLETTSDGRDLVTLLSAYDGIEDLLCFSSDYPHYTMDDFGFAARTLPRAWHDKVFYENARSIYRWRDLPAVAEAPMAVEV